MSAASDFAPEFEIDPKQLAAERLTQAEYVEIVKRLGRKPNPAELGMFGVMWSEHCCYKNSRPLLKQFPTTGERILVGPGENAGVVDLGEGLRLAFKIESHNHPSAVEPFQGAATGVGGILRDIFTMGARPIALLNSLRFGDLADPKTQRLVHGVISGISHYGNCLIGSETFIWRDDKGVYFDTIGNFVHKTLTPGQTTQELDNTQTIETLSIDPDTHQSCWQRVRRVFLRQASTLMTVRTDLGRTLTVTLDHPMLVHDRGNWDVCPAHQLKVGDEIPLLTQLPKHPRDHFEALSLDLFEHLPLSHASDIYVKLPENWEPTPLFQTALTALEPSISKRCSYKTGKKLPLSHFLKLEPMLDVARHQVMLYRRGKANKVCGVIHPNQIFARLLGYFLSEGCVSKNGNTYKIIFVFAHHENEYVYDVIEGLEFLGLRPCVEKRKSSIAVYATSWLLGHYFKNVWQCGTEAKDKKIPDFVFQWPHQLQSEVLKGLLRGDGSLTTKTHGNHAKITFATISHQLFEQVVFLVQQEGAIPSIYKRASSEGEIEGRKHTRQPLWQLEINNFVGLNALVNTFSQERTLALSSAISRYSQVNYSFPRHRKLSHQLATVKVKSIEVKSVEPCQVYDVEVDHTHLFVTTSGIITHNCVGVPTVGGEVYFDAAYSGNPLVNVMALGLMETTEIVKSGAAGIGNPVIYVGSTTGRDGMGGASFASAELSEASQADRPAVQVGDPFLEKSLIEACLEAFQTGAIVAAQDMGAAGLTCSTSEMAAKGGVGIDLDLDLIPARESGMIPYEYLLSESQERMLFVAQAGREQEIIDIFQRWELHAVVAGMVIAEPIVRIRHQGKIAAEIPALALAENTPIYHRESLSEPPEYVKNAQAWSVSSLPTASETGISLDSGFLSWSEVLLKLLASPTVASKAWVYRQYDHQVQNNTVAGPGAADAAVIRLRPATGEKLSNPYVGVAATVDCNPRYVYLDPYQGAMVAVAEAARNLSCVGAEPLAVTDNLNFGSPEQPLGYWQLSEACRGLSQACRVLNTPVTGGNVSLYNETLDAQGQPQAIYPTPVVGMVGRVDDVRKTVGQGWQKSGDLIYLLGQPLTPKITTESITLGGSEYLATIHHLVTGKPPYLDLELEQQVQKICREGISQAWIRTAHDLSEGGLGVALAESCISGNFGATITLPWALAETVSRWDELLFGEGGSRILVAVDPDAHGAWETYLNAQETMHAQKIGQVTNAAGELQILTIDHHSLINVAVDALIDRWANGLGNHFS